MNKAVLRIGDVLMRCRSCGHECRLYDCNGDDPIGDGLFGCPIDEDGGHWGAKIVALCRECAKYWEIVVVHVGKPVATNAGEEN